MSCVHPASQPAALHSKNMQTVQSVFSYLPCLKAPLSSVTVSRFTDLDLACGSQGQCKGKPLGFISRTFYLIRIKFDVVMKQFKLNILSLHLSKIC